MRVLLISGVEYFGTHGFRKARDSGKRGLGGLVNSIRSVIRPAAVMTQLGFIILVAGGHGVRGNPNEKLWDSSQIDNNNTPPI